MKFRRMNIATNGHLGRHALDSIHAIFLYKTLSRRPGVKDNDWIIFLEYDALLSFQLKCSSNIDSIHYLGARADQFI
jgi:hypothetical protein